MLDLMPSPRLVFHEWDRHGTCSGLSVRAYFETVRKARAVVKIPSEFLQVEQPLSVSPDQVKEAFVKANAGLSSAAISVSCDRKQRLSVVRLCLGKDLQFRDCPDVERGACRREQVVMPAVRGG
jgi:ribonuclease T2